MDDVVQSCTRRPGGARVRTAQTSGCSREQNVDPAGSASIGPSGLLAVVLAPVVLAVVGCELQVNCDRFQEKVAGCASSEEAAQVGQACRERDGWKDDQERAKVLSACMDYDECSDFVGCVTGQIAPPEGASAGEQAIQVLQLLMTPPDGRGTSQGVQGPGPAASDPYGVAPSGVQYVGPHTQIYYTGPGGSVPVVRQVAPYYRSTPSQPAP